MILEAMTGKEVGIRFEKLCSKERLIKWVSKILLTIEKSTLESRPMPGIRDSCRCLYVFS